MKKNKIILNGNPRQTGNSGMYAEYTFQKEIQRLEKLRIKK